MTKQLQQDGTSKTVVYKPVENGMVEPQPKYMTIDEFNSNIKSLDKSKELQELRDELKSLKKRLRFFVDDKKEE